MAIGTTAAIIGGASIAIGAIGSVISGKNASNSAEKIAKEQRDMALSVLSQQKADRERALGISAPTMQELYLIQRQTQLSEQGLAAQLASIKFDEDLMNSVDPALKEAGKQAFDLLMGKEAAALAPLRSEQARQRTALESNLRGQLGSGYATSSAGVEALSSFDRQSQGALADAQQNTLGSFLGLSASIRPDVSGKLGRAFGDASAISGSALAGQQNIAGRNVAAFTGSGVNYQNVISTAGAGNIGGLQNAQSMGNLFGNISGIGGSIIGKGMDAGTLGQFMNNRNSQGGQTQPGFNLNFNPQPYAYNSSNFGTIR